MKGPWLKKMDISPRRKKKRAWKKGDPSQSVGGEEPLKKRRLKCGNLPSKFYKKETKKGAPLSTISFFF